VQDLRVINVGLQEILTESDYSSKIVTVKLCKATDVIRSMSENGQNIANGVVPRKTTLNTMPMDENLLKIVRKFGERILLKESDLLPKKLKKKTRRRVASSTMNTNKQLVCSADWQGPPPWDSSLGGDGCPKFLLDVMVFESISVFCCSFVSWFYLIRGQEFDFTYLVSLFLNVTIFSRIHVVS